MWQRLNNVEFVGNELSRLVLFFMVILVSLIIGKLGQLLVKSMAERPGRKEGQEWKSVFLKALAGSMVVVAFALGFRFAVLVLNTTPRLDSLLKTGSGVINSIVIGCVIYKLVDVIDHFLLRFALRTESKVDDVLAPLVGKAIRITVMVLVILNVAVEVSGKDMTTILAGMGVGGLAIALAGQDAIKNFFGSIVIFGDKPFEIGDRVVVDGEDGAVETVGFRSTKIRTLDGHLVTVPNSEMVNQTVRNIGERPFIKRVANIAITYDTPPDKVQRALEILKEILADHEGMEKSFPPRIYFNEFCDSSLNILVIYWYHPPDYWKYMEFSEKVNMQILSRFNDEGIEFAFPTQTLHVNKS